MVKLYLNCFDFKLENKAIINNQNEDSEAKPPKFYNKFLKLR